MPNDLLQYLAEHRTAMIDDITTFVERETFSSDKPSLDAFATFLEEFARRRSGGAATIAHEEKAGNHVVVRWEGALKVAPVVIIGHFDTVWPPGSITSTVPLKSEGDIMRGPGIFDMKTGLVQGFWAIHALKTHNPDAHVRITGGLNRPPMACSPEIAALYEQAREHAASIGFALREASSGGGSDANFCAALGKPVLDGLGAVGAGAHALSEHIDTRFLVERTALIATLVSS